MVSVWDSTVSSRPLLSNGVRSLNTSALASTSSISLSSLHAPRQREARPIRPGAASRSPSPAPANCSTPDPWLRIVAQRASRTSSIALNPLTMGRTASTLLAPDSIARGKWMRGLAWWPLALAIVLLACSPGAVPPPASTPAPAAQARAAVQPLNPPVKVRYGSQETVGGVGLYLAQEKGYFKEEGLEVEFERVTGGPDAVPALASGDLDFSQGALDPATFNAILRGIPIKFVTHLSLNRTDQVSSGLLIRQDLVDGGRFRELPDVKGMTIAIGPGTGSSAEMYLSRVLASVGLTIADVDP